LGRKALPFILDVTKADDVQSAFENVIGELGGLDILVNNAGGTSDLFAVQPSDAKGFVPTWQISEEMWDVFLCDAPVEMRGQSILQF
jgi:NAD(P)-dependent dehydrogenase (short-subunit alcohol dehydrogenase family)